MAFPILSRAEMRAWEQSSWAAGATEAGVIDLVGKALAQELTRLARPDERVLIISGKGNNGADALAAGRHLAGRQIGIVEIRDPVSDLPRLQERLADFRPHWILDGLFGIGLSRPLNDAWQAVIKVINNSGCRIAAVDIPSGLDADSGLPMGSAVAADLTLTVGTPKIGMISPGAAGFVGRIEVISDIGLTNPPESKAGLYWTAAGDFLGFPPGRAALSHKGTFGHLSVLAGSPGYHGAAVLAARGALCARPGLVSVVTLSTVFLQVGSHLASAMVHRYKPKQSLPDKTTAILAGPGLAAAGNIPADFRDWIQRLWRESFLPMVADASTLDWLPRRAVGSNPGRIITPHPGEAGRMLHLKPEEVMADRIGALRSLSQLYGSSWVVLKGHQTLIGRHTGPIYVNSTGNPGLAQGGTGDVLSGFIGGLIAQPALLADPCLAIRYAVWEHGRAADLLEADRSNWTSADLPELLGRHLPTGNRSIWRTQRTASRE